MEEDTKRKRGRPKKSEAIPKPPEPVKQHRGRKKGYKVVKESTKAVKKPNTENKKEEQQTIQVEKQIVVLPHDEVQGLLTDTFSEGQQRNITCIRCGEINPNNFYNTKDKNRQVFGKICYCKRCIKEMFLEYYNKYGDENCATWYTCRKIDIPYVHECYIGAIKSLGSYDTYNGFESLMAAYMKNMGFADKNGWGSTFDDSSGEEHIRKLAVVDTITKVKRNRANDFVSQKADSDYEESEYDTIEYDTAVLQAKWGATMEVWELAFLEGEYLDWDEKLGGIDDKSIDVLVKQICYQTLEINKDRQSGLSVDKKIKTLRDLMSDSGLMEKQNANAKKRKTLGMTIEDLERFRPVATPEPIFDDVDGVENYIKGSAGCFFKVIGIENEYTKFYDEWMKNYKVNTITDMLEEKQAEKKEIARISAEPTGNS